MTASDRATLDEALARALAGALVRAVRAERAGDLTIHLPKAAGSDRSATAHA